MKTISDNYKFIDLDKVFELSVKKEFLAEIPDSPEKIPMYDLLEKYHIYKWFHNTTGPAIKNLKIPQHEEYFINGQQISDEQEIAKLKHTNQFNDGFDKMLREDANE